MHLLHRDQILLSIQTLSLALLAVRIWWSGLYRLYPCFFLYLAADLLQATILASVPYGTLLYRDSWVATEGLIACSYALVILELYSVVLRDLVGIARLSRRYIMANWALAVSISLIMLTLESTSTYLAAGFLLVERVIVTSLVILVLLVSFYLAYYPVPLNRNVVVYSLGYVVYFLTKAATLLLTNHSHQWPPFINVILIGVSTACLIFWLFALSPQGEKKTLVVGHRWNLEDEALLLAKLRAINERLIRAGGE